MNFEILDTTDEESLDGVLICYALQGFEHDGRRGEVVVRFVGAGHDARVELPARYDVSGFTVAEPPDRDGVRCDHIELLRSLLEADLNPDEDVDF